MGYLNNVFLIFALTFLENNIFLEIQALLFRRYPIWRGRIRSFPNNISAKDNVTLQSLITNKRFVAKLIFYFLGIWTVLGGLKPKNIVYIYLFIFASDYIVVSVKYLWFFSGCKSYFLIHSWDDNVAPYLHI